MPSINLEMMKQLLEEFSEKEALTTEEISVIETEISSLEQRVVSCRSKLKNLGGDKEKLSIMQERYVKGNFSQYTQVASPEIVEQHIPQANETASLPASAHTNLPQPTTNLDKASRSIDIPVSTDKTTNQAVSQQTQIAEPSPQESEPAAQTTEPDKPNKEKEKTPSDDPSTHKEGSEPIKSINDALKGLFRK